MIISKELTTYRGQTRTVLINATLFYDNYIHTFAFIHNAYPMQQMQQ